MVSRLSPEDADFAITSRDGEVALLLGDEGLTLQLTDRALREVRREMDSDLDREDGLFASMIGVVVRSSVRSVLDHGLRYGLEDLDDVRFRDGRLVITDREGHRVLESVEIGGNRALEGFAPRDAQALADRFRRLKRKWH